MTTHERGINMQASMPLTAKEAAVLLGISARQIYCLAEEGKIPHYRFGGAVRFERIDIEKYKQSCRSNGKRTRAKPVAGATNLTASLTGKESGLVAYFRKAGLDPARKHSTAKRRRASMLKLAV